MSLDKIRCTAFKEYDEQEALNTLRRNADIAIESDVARMKANERADADQITIIVNGTAHGFYLGGPQIDALYAFIEHICDENMHDYPDGCEARPLDHEEVRRLLQLCYDRILCKMMTKDGITTGDVWPAQEHKIDTCLEGLVDTAFEIIEQNTPHPEVPSDV